MITQAYVEGVSTRSVDDLVQAWGIDSGTSKSQVSRICAKRDVEVDTFRNRSLAHIEFPYVYLGCHVRQSSRHRSASGRLQGG